MSAGNELDPGYGAAPAAAELTMGEQNKPSVAEMSAGPATSAPQLSPMMQHFGDASSAALARFNKLKVADKTLKKVREEMDKLTALGDMVSEDDVLGTASELVAAGLTAPAVAGLLATLPQTPEGIRQWVAQHDQDVQKREAQLDQVMRLAQHELATTGLRQLIGQAAEDHQTASNGGLSAN